MLAQISKLSEHLAGLKGQISEQDRIIQTTLEVRRGRRRERSLSDESISLLNKCLEEKLAFARFIEEIETQGLREIFDRAYTYQLAPSLDDQGVLKGVQPLLSLGDADFEDPMDDEGDGVQEMISFLFRLGALVFSPTQNLLVMDEPWRGVSSTLCSRLDAFVETLCTLLGIQLIIVTHDPHDSNYLYRVRTRTSKSTGRYSVVERVESS